MSRALSDSQLTVIEAYGDATWETITNNNLTRLNNVLLKIQGLLDVDTTGLQDGDIIVWSTAESKWVRRVPPRPLIKMMPTSTSTTTTSSSTSSSSTTKSTQTTGSTTVSTFSTTSSSKSTVTTHTTKTTHTTGCTTISTTTTTTTATTAPPWTFNEDFEGTGYENEDWTEVNDYAATIDPDASTSIEGWGSQCLEIGEIYNSPASAYITRLINGDDGVASAYVRVEFEIIALDHDNLGIVRFGIPGDIFGTWAWNLRIYDTDTLELSVNSGGVNSPSVYGTSLVAETKYRVEVFWERNGDWEWKVNEVTVQSGTSTDDIGDVRTFCVGICWCSTYVDLAQVMRFDHIEINSGDWPGA